MPRTLTPSVVAAKAGTQERLASRAEPLDPRFRGNDEQATVTQSL